MRSVTGSAPPALSYGMALEFAVGGAIIPFIGILLRDRGLSYAEISWVFLAASGTNLAFPFLWGMLADRYVPLNRLFTAMNACALGALAWFSAQTEFFGLFLGFILFYAFFHPTLSLMNALCYAHMKEPRRQFGAVRAWGSAGWLLPSLPISLWLIGTGREDLEFTLAFGGALLFAMAALTLRFPHTAPGGAGAAASSRRPGYWPAVRRLARDRDLLVMLGAQFLMVGSFSIVVYYSPPFLEELGLPRPWVGPAHGFGVALEIVLFPLLQRFLSRWGYGRLLALGGACLVLRHAAYALTDNLWVLVLSYALVGMTVIFFLIIASLWVNDVASAETRATAQTLLVLVGPGFGPMFSNWAAGALAQGGSGDLRPVFAFAAAQAVAACGLMLARGGRWDASSQGRALTPS